MAEVTKRENGAHHQTDGRDAPALPTFTFKDTGITVSIRKVSPLFQQGVRKAFPPPQPPMQEVDYGDGKKVMEPNEAHPDHQAALVEYAAELEQRMRKLLIKRGVEVEVDQAAVEQARVDAREAGMDLDPDDKYVYVAYCCLGSWDDYSELIDKITRRSQPTEEAIREAVATF